MTHPVDLRPDHLAIVQDILCAHLSGDVKVWVFGSRANWTTQDSSDLDLALESESRLSHKLLGALQDAFADSVLPYTVDIVDLNRIGDAFRQIVESQRAPMPMQGDATAPRVRPTFLPAGRAARLGSVIAVDVGPWREAMLSECTVINDALYSPHDGWTVIHYLDTDSITENRIAKMQRLELGKDPLPSRARRKVQPGDIVYSTVRPNRKHFGMLKRVPSNCLVSTEFAVLRGRKGLADTDFIYWFLAQNHIVDYLHSVAENSPSAYPSITPRDLGQVIVSLPPIAQQRTIAHVLGTLDDKIGLNRQMNQTLEAMVQAIFQDWFVDLGPVRAKRAGEEPYLSSALWDLFPDRLVNSELGEIPEGWKVKALGECATVFYGVSFASKRFNQRREGLPLLRIRDLATHDPGVFTDERPARGQLIRAGNIVVGMEGEFRAHIWKGPASWLNQRVCGLKPHGGVPRAFLFASLTRPLAEFARSKVGTTAIHLGQTDIDSIKLIMPPIEILRFFDDLSEPIVQKLVENASEIRLLSSQRDTLLPKLVAGEIGMKVTTGVI